MSVLLPRLMDLGKLRGWKEELLSAWKQTLEALPPIPRGRLEFDPKTGAGQILPGDLLVPAEDLSKADPPRHINRQNTELYAIWPANLMLRSPADREAAESSYHARQWQHLKFGWNLDMVFAACLGLDEEVDLWFDHHFDATHTFPCGLAQEASPKQGDCEAISMYPSMHGLGTSIVRVIERLIRDYPDRLVVLPCWPVDVPIRFALFSPFAGRVEVAYDPGESLVNVTTQRVIEVELREAWADKVRLVVEHNGQA